MVVSQFRVLHLVRLVGPLFLGPALINTLQTPFGAALGGANRLAIDDDKNRIRVRRRINPQRHPTAPLDLHVKRHVLQLAIRDDRFLLNRNRTKAKLPFQGKIVAIA